MEFWGIEVKPGETVKCNPGEEKYLHLSQVSLGEVKKDKRNEDIPVSVKFNDRKLVVGTLSAEKCAQIPQDLVFEQEFEVFNPSKSTTIYFLGYKTVADVEEQMPYGSDSDDSDEDDEIQFDQKANGKPVPKEKAKSKEDVSSAKQKAKVDELKKPLVEEEEDEDGDSSDDDSSDDSSDEMDADDDSEDSDDEEDDATPKKNGSDKRPAGSALKTPVPEKKAKLLSPAASQKSGVTDGKKGGSVHTATPHPNKQMAKTSANASKSPASNVTCKLCSKGFKSDSALQSHNAAKHSAGK